MTLVVFDLDGTLLDKGSKISTYTAETLAKMRARNIPYTVATGRTLQAATGATQGPSLHAAADSQKWCDHLVTGGGALQPSSPADP